MILAPFSVDGIGFATLAAAVVLAAWSRRQTVFLPVFALVSAVMLASWLGPWDFAAAVAFLVPPYFAIRWRWGREDRAAGPALALMLAWQVVLFIVIRGYGPADVEHMLGHPVSVIGISYVLFRQIHLLVDAPDLGDLPFDPLRYFAYVAAFWTLLAGPIQRYEDFAEGLADMRPPPVPERIKAGHRIVNGLILGFLVAPLFLPTQDLALLRKPDANWVDFVIVFYSFPIYLYLNFTGYSDVMIGLSRLAGMTTMPENFRRPYLGRNIQDFWTRWHISLSTWIGQYVFTNMSASIMRRAPSRWHKPLLLVALVLTFQVVGMWHGTTINYVIFGAMHAAGVIAMLGYDWVLTRALGKAGKKTFNAHPMVRGSAVFLCINYVCFTMFLVNYRLPELGQTMLAFWGQTG